jgi:hypothetical protein
MTFKTQNQVVIVNIIKVKKIFIINIYLIMSIVYYSYDKFKENYQTTLDRNYVVKIDFKSCVSWFHPKTDGAIINIFESCCPLHTTAKRIDKYIYLIFDSLKELNTFLKNVNEKFPNSRLYVHVTSTLWK